jgi:hypothetical protein
MPRGVVASWGLAVTALLLAGCGKEPVAIDALAPAGSDGERCAKLVDALPDDLSDQHRRLISPAAAPGAAWGDPPIVLTCGGSWPVPPSAVCVDVNGVGWHAPSGDVLDLSKDSSAGAVTLTTIGAKPAVRLEVPADYFPPATALVDVAPALKATLTGIKGCD